MTVLLISLLTACGPQTDVTWELPEHGVMVVREQHTTTTRTPLGMEEVVVDKSLVWRVLDGGTVGQDDVAWREEVGSWTVKYTDLGGSFQWQMGEGQALPEKLVMLAPTQPREVYVSAGGEVRIVQLSPPEPEPEPEPTRRRRRSDPPPPEPVPWAANNRIQSWVLGFVHAPGTTVRRGTDWTWGGDKEVTRSANATTQSSWELERVDEGLAVLRESIALQGSRPPSAGFFQTTALAGGADVRLATDSHRLLTYSSRYEADIASPSARGTAVRVSEVTFEVP